MTIHIPECPGRVGGSGHSDVLVDDYHTRGTDCLQVALADLGHCLGIIQSD